MDGMVVLRQLKVKQIASLGDSGGDGVGITSGSVIAHLQSGSLGKTFNPSYVGGVQMLIFGSSSKATLSDSNATGLSSFGYVNFSGGSRRLMVVFPSASNQGGKPVSMYDGVPPDSTGTLQMNTMYMQKTQPYLVQLEQVYITSILKMQ